MSGDYVRWLATESAAALSEEGAKAMTEMIHAGDISPDVTLLINDSGQYVLRTGDQSVEIDGGDLAKALERTRPVADLVARSQTPISGMSPAIERSLAHFGCAREGSPGKAGD